jgi:exonuclease SbcD
LRGRFAHISDCHIGAWRDPKLRELNDSAFANAIDLCTEKQVDFAIISGDIFDIGIPEMSSVRYAVRKLKGLVDHGVPVYVVYGSHDYSPTTVSVVEVLTEAGLFSNVGEFDEEINQEEKERKLSLKPIIDEKTQAQIGGLPARRGGLEKSYYAELKGSVSQSIDPNNYSIFVFHASVNELQALNIPIEQSVSIDDLPRGFSYYAGGHLHKRSMDKIGESPIVYPGPLFGTSYSDLELTAKGEKRGFAIVEFEGNKTLGVDFVDLPSPRILSKTFNADGKTSNEVDNDLRDFVSKDTLQVKDSIVLLKIRGTLSQGKPSDIDFYSYRALLLERGASVASINRMGLSTREAKRLEMIGKGSKEEIESNLLAEHISSFKAKSQALEFLSMQREGLARASRLLSALKTEKKEEETKPTFEKRVINEASEILNFPIE